MSTDIFKFGRNVLALFTVGNMSCTYIKPCIMHFGFAFIFFEYVPNSTFLL
jgi:hypothetical protein